MAQRDMRGGNYAAELQPVEIYGERRRRLAEAVGDDLRERRLLWLGHALSLAVLAVPDAVHAASPAAHAEGWRDGVLVVPYSLTLSFVLVVYRLSVRFGAVPAAEEKPAKATPAAAEKTAGTDMPPAPAAAKMMTAGPQTRAVPIPGMMESTAMIVPQNTALGMPTTQKAMPARTPCNIPMTAVPFRVARVTEVNFASMRCSSWS